MSEILRQLSQLFVRSVPTVLFVFFLLVVLDRLFFRPILEVMKKRDASTRGAMEKAREQAAASEAKAQQYAEAFQAARQEVYRQREAHRREGLAEREKELVRTREHAEGLLKEALDTLARDVETLKQDLGQAAAPLAAEITETVLSGGQGPAGGEKGAGN
jgi:F0F1-type ATP synthase membrane subunit b/b'